MEKEHGKVDSVEHSLCEPTQGELAKPTMAITAHNQEISIRLARGLNNGIWNSAAGPHDISRFHTKVMLTELPQDSFIDERRRDAGRDQLALWLKDEPQFC